MSMIRNLIVASSLVGLSTLALAETHTKGTYKCTVAGKKAPEMVKDKAACDALQKKHTGKADTKAGTTTTTDKKDTTTPADTATGVETDEAGAEQ